MSQPNPQRQVECPQCAKMFKRVCDMAKHHDDLHANAKLVLVPEGKPVGKKKNIPKNLKDWPGRIAVIDSNSNGRAVVRVMMSLDTIGPRPRDPTVDLPQKEVCPDCGFQAASSGSYTRHRIRHHRTGKGGKKKKRSEKASTPLGRVDAASGTTAASVAVSAVEAEPASSITVFSVGAPMQPAVSGTCRNCGQHGHYVQDCKKPSRMPGNRPMMGGSGRPNLMCRNCMQDGHVAKNCPLPQQQRDMVRPAEDGARQLEELYARVVQAQRNLTFLQQQAQLGIPASRPGNVMGNMPGNMGGNMPGNMGGNMPRNMGGNMPGNMGGNMPGNLGGNMPGNMGRNMPGNLGGNMPGNLGGNMPGNLGGNMPGNLGGNMPGASYGMGGGFSGSPQGIPYGMGSQMGLNMGMPFGNVLQLQGRQWYRDT